MIMLTFFRQWSLLTTFFQNLYVFLQFNNIFSPVLLNCRPSIFQQTWRCSKLIIFIYLNIFPHRILLNVVSFRILERCDIFFLNFFLGIFETAAVEGETLKFWISAIDGWRGHDFSWSSVIFVDARKLVLRIFTQVWKIC
jgi:hypothetical protein